MALRTTATMLPNTQDLIMEVTTSYPVRARRHESMITLAGTLYMRSASSTEAPIPAARVPPVTHWCQRSLHCCRRGWRVCSCPMSIISAGFLATCAPDTMHLMNAQGTVPSKDHAEWHSHWPG